jgi:hypothetical protein
MSIKNSGLGKKNNVNIDELLFLNNYTKHSVYSKEYKKIQVSKTFNYDQELNVNINLIGDLLHKCFFQIDLPVLDIKDNIITDSKYKTLKNNKLSNIQTEIDFFTEEYNNFYNYSNIQISIYNELKSIFVLKNLTIEFLKSKINTSLNDLSDDINKFKLLVDANILSQINIIAYINNLTSLDNLDSIIKEVDKMYLNIINYLNYYHSNKVYQEKKYNYTNTGKISYNWVKNIGHHYFNNFEFNLDGHIMDNYSNDYLHIYQSHNISSDMVENYNNMIGNNNNIYIKKSTPNYIYTPLLFWFCKDISQSLPLVGLMNSKLKINAHVNKLSNLIYFQDWEDYYNNILIIDILRKDHDINDDTNTIVKKINNVQVELILPENIYRYKCTVLNKQILDLKFTGINSDSILNNYGSTDSDGNKYLSLDDFIYLMNNLKTDTLLPENTKILLGDYHYFVDYNYLLSLVPKPNINLIAEYCYVDDVEKKLLATKRIKYLTEIHNEIILDINKNSIYDSLNEFNGLVKEIYYFSQLKLNLEGKSKYGESQLNNYINNNIEKIELKLSNEHNLFEFNNMEPYYLLESQVPDGVNYTSFSLDPNNIQPTGTLNMSNIKGQNVEIILNQDDYNTYYNNKNNPNKLGAIFKILYVKYNLFEVEKGKGKLLYY